MIFFRAHKLFDTEMELQVKNVSASYGSRDVLRCVNGTVASGELVSVVGPSGSGKSTLLRALAGLTPPDVTGSILFDGLSVANRSPQLRNVGFVFQDLALYPHLRVYDNIAMGLRFAPTEQPRPSAALLHRRVETVAKRLGVSEYLSRFPKQLSGGQQQRVALARAIVRAPKLNLLLLDEPFSGLDPMLRASVRDLLKSLHQEIGITTICVTHDRLDAVTISDRILVLRDGVALQMDTPGRLFDNPANLFVATFLAEFPLNQFPATIGVGDQLTLAFAGFRVHIPLAPSIRLTRHSCLTVVIRPEAFRLARECLAPSSDHAHALSLALIRRDRLGERSLLSLAAPDGTIVSMVTSRRAEISDGHVEVCLHADDIMAFDDSGVRIELR